jgi:hypothetical protein
MMAVQTVGERNTGIDAEYCRFNVGLPHGDGDLKGSRIVVPLEGVHYAKIKAGSALGNHESSNFARGSRAATDEV